MSAQSYTQAGAAAIVLLRDIHILHDAALRELKHAIPFGP